MATPPTLAQFIDHYERAETALAQAWQQDEPHAQQRLAALGQGYATLALVDATWLAQSSTSTAP